MLRLAAKRGPLHVVNDQTLTPTATYALSEQLVTLATCGEFGTYHATCQGECTWFDFAQEIFRQADLRVDLRPQSTAASGARARRPRYSVLENRQLKRLASDVLPTWQEALIGYLRQRATLNSPVRN